jgi:hypothetical protein
MAVLGFADNDADIVFARKAVFRMILNRAKTLLTDPADIHQLDVCKAMEGVSFELLDEGQRIRLLDAVFDATTALRQDIAAGKPTEEPIRAGIDDKLDEVLILLARFRQ